MSKEYIEREATLKNFCEWCNKEYGLVSCEPSKCPFIKYISKVPTVDVVNVIRCGECIYAKERVKIKDCVICDKYSIYKDINGYCDAGLRKDEKHV